MLSLAFAGDAWRIGGTRRVTPSRLVRVGFRRLPRKLAEDLPEHCNPEAEINGLQTFQMTAEHMKEE